MVAALVWHSEGIPVAALCKGARLDTVLVCGMLMPVGSAAAKCLRTASVSLCSFAAVNICKLTVLVEGFV